MREINVGPASAFRDPGRKLIECSGIEVGVFKLGDEFFAYENICPHLGGPACQGKIIAKVEEVVADDRTSKGLKFSETKINMVCPWHERHPDWVSPRRLTLSTQTDQGEG